MLSEESKRRRLMGRLMKACVRLIPRRMFDARWIWVKGESVINRKYPKGV